MAPFFLACLLLSGFSLKGQELHLHKGLNTLSLHTRDAVDVVATFQPFKKKIQLKMYDTLTQTWGYYPPLTPHKGATLAFIPPKREFFIFTPKPLRVTLHFHTMKEGKCTTLQSSMQTLLDQGDDTNYTFSPKHDIAVASGYLTHHQHQKFSDNRVMLFYTQLQGEKHASYRYGSAIPKVAFKFAKQYEGKIFYLYSYYDDTCYKGVFPSQKIPPFPFLKKMK